MSNELERTDTNQILIFSLDEPHYAIHLSSVERVIRAVETTPLPKGPPLVSGVINMHGQVIPVLDIRTCFGLATRDGNPDDRFILVHTSQRILALVADSVQGVYELEQKDWVTSREILPGVTFLNGLAKLNGELILLCDLEQFLSCDDTQKLEEALTAGSKKKEKLSRKEVSESA